MTFAKYYPPLFIEEACSYIFYISVRKYINFFNINLIPVFINEKTQVTYFETNSSLAKSIHTFLFI
ncbi:hypothetical protein KL86DYS1_31399 [uncultured Dysgonomonas sp.]|uniref:Uncharacterized protein n=1 Tax=uncultured Dysgonomonas sp. TaxID=206096 RepID=A0A212K4G5_9BACT|nr:hypothetical protein KL86DYS1_31399 [uncultured Dysgonomonas sp.]